MLEGYPCIEPEMGNILIQAMRILLNNFIQIVQCSLPVSLIPLNCPRMWLEQHPDVKSIPPNSPQMLLERATVDLPVYMIKHLNLQCPVSRLMY